MAVSKKTLKIFFIGGIIIVVAGSLIYIFRCKLFNLSSCVPDPNKNNEPVPQGSASTTWVPEFFPLALGMYGPKIKAMQSVLGIAADGKFGPQTQSAVKAKIGKPDVSQADYDKIINPATSGGSNYQQLKAALGSGAQTFTGGVYYLLQGKNKNYRIDFYTNGRLFLYELGATQLKEIKRGSYSNGGKTMKIDGGDTFTKGVYENMTMIVAQYGQ